MTRPPSIARCERLAADITERVDFLDAVRIGSLEMRVLGFLDHVQQLTEDRGPQMPGEWGQS